MIFQTVFKYIGPKTLGQLIHPLLYLKISFPYKQFDQKAHGRKCRCLIIDILVFDVPRFIEARELS